MLINNISNLQLLKNILNANFAKIIIGEVLGLTNPLYLIKKEVQLANVYLFQVLGILVLQEHWLGQILKLE